MSLYKTRAVVLGSRSFDESSKLVSFFTRDYGKIPVIAKGAKRPTSRFGGRLETFCYVDLMIASGRNLDILSQVELLDSFGRIRKNPDRLNLGFYFIKVIEASTLAGQKNEKLFKLLLLGLKKLSDGEGLGYLIKYFEINLLKAEGLYRDDGLPEDLISAHLDKDVKEWKKNINIAAYL